MRFAEWLLENDWRPGQEMPDQNYDRFEPEQEPVDWEEWMRNVFADYGTSDEINNASGYLLRNGEVIQMGGYHRDQDHRFATPSSQAMRRWGWPSNVADEYDQGTSTPAMYELMKRSGALRIHASGGHFNVHGFRWPSNRQKDVILHYVINNRPRSVQFELPQIGSVEVSEPFEVEDLLSR